MKVKDIPDLRQKVMAMLPVLQSEVWKKLDLSSREGSELIEIMLGDKLIKRKAKGKTFLIVISNGGSNGDQPEEKEETIVSELSETQKKVLDLLPITQADLWKKLDIDSSSCSELIRKMVDKKLVKRTKKGSTYLIEKADLQTTAPEKLEIAEIVSPEKLEIAEIVSPEKLEEAEVPYKAPETEAETEKIEAEAEEIETEVTKATHETDTIPETTEAIPETETEVTEVTPEKIIEESPETEVAPEKLIEESSETEVEKLKEESPETEVTPEKEEVNEVPEEVEIPEKMEDDMSIKKLRDIPGLRKQVMDMLPIMQSEIWKKLEIDRRGCSRLINDMIELNLIKKTKIGGSYLIESVDADKPKKNFSALLSKSGKFSPCCGCEKECEPINCKSLVEWSLC